jgi:ATP-dependent 26S proteasome regulatory subunit
MERSASIDEYNQPDQGKQNMMYNMLMMSVCGSIISAIAANIPTLFNYLLKLSNYIFALIYKRYICKFKSRIEFVITIIKSPNGININLSEESNAILNKLNNKQIRNIIHGRKMIDTKYKHNNDDTTNEKNNKNNNVLNDTDDNYAYYFGESQTFTIDENITVQVTEPINDKEKPDNKSESVFFQSLIVVSNIYSIEQLKETVNQWKNDLVMLSDDDKYSCVKLTGEIISSYFNGNQMLFPTEFDAIISYIKRNDLAIKNIEYATDQTCKTNVLNKKESICVIPKRQKVKLNNDIICTFDSYEKTNYSIDRKVYVIELKSSTLSVTQLKKFIDELVKYHMEEIKINSNIEKLLCFKSDVAKEISRTAKLKKKDTEERDNHVIKEDVITWTQIEMKSNKTFDNIFFKDKNTFLHRLNTFMSNEESYIKKGIPYNFGLLLHGSPGTGKTSCIKALANYTKRHIIFVNLKLIKTCKQFEEIFLLDYINNMYVPHCRKIIVLEDIDCMSDIVISRDDAKPIGPNEDEIYDDKLTLSCILNTIDGIFENHDRIMIMTTNYVDKLDEALVRPGRIDMKIEFTKCTQQMYYDILELCYYPHKVNKKTVFTESKHTPAEVFNVCNLCDSIDQAIVMLT